MGFGSEYRAEFRATGVEESIRQTVRKRSEANISVVFSSASGRTRTCNPWFRRPVLYPIELRTRVWGNVDHLLKRHLPK